MCTIFLFFRAHPAAGLIVAANRDELFSRPSAAPQLLHLDYPRVLGGLDLQAGGTWMGVNQNGLFVALTNMRSAATGRRSRGEVVLELLTAVGPLDARERLLDLGNRHSYRPFNLLFGSSTEMWVAYARDDHLTIQPVTPGVHVLCSGGTLDDPLLPKVARAQSIITQAADEPDLDKLSLALRHLLADHQQPSPRELPPHLANSSWGSALECALQAICVHTPGYGTCSSTILALDKHLASYEFCDGPPCQASWNRFEHLLR